MPGLLTWSDHRDGRHRHDRVIFVCERGELRYNNVRRFGGLWLARDARERDQVTGPLGPDAAQSPATGSSSCWPAAGAAPRPR